MHRAPRFSRQHPRSTASQPRVKERRLRLAQEAARLMAEGGSRDFHQAKRKAAERLGISDDALLPRNSEIEEALREYQRLFQPENLDAVLRRREAALQAMEFFAGFAPRLVGPVLDGTADARSPVALHLHTDDADAAPRFLQQHGIPAELRSRRMRLDRERCGDFPSWHFSADGIAFDITVLPHDVLRQAPLSALDQKPVRRASASQLRQLLGL
ncbi:MAG: hypothetical protein M3Q11_02180 [Pseudomonadota bacterium]|nr:hypothetical protein [Pseudomonadota bacterium]